MLGTGRFGGEPDGSCALSSSHGGEAMVCCENERTEEMLNPGFFIGGGRGVWRVVKDTPEYQPTGARNSSMPVVD